MPDERARRLPITHLGLERAELLGLDVRRVGDDEVVGPAGQSLAHVVEHELHALCQAREGSVLAGERERVLGDVNRGHRSIRPLVRDGERDGACARADVEHSRRGHTVEQRQATLDDDLGLRPRDERAPVDLQHQPPEAPLAEDVGERLARTAPADELTADGLLVLRQRPVVLEVDVKPRQAERLGDEVLGIDARARHSLAGQELRRRRDDVADGHPCI